MKKLLSLLFLVTISLSAYAQKTYINITVGDLYNDEEDSYGQKMTLTGAIPSGIKTYYAPSQGISIGSLLNMLSQQGYEIEAVTNVGTSLLNFLLSKQSSGQSNAIQRVRSDNDEEITEVARYNLQGMPVNESEKGVQIIVYSNYTTKTVIVQ